MVYDALDRPVLVQDAVQRTRGEWAFTKYDAFGRVAYTGIFSHPTPGRVFWQNYASSVNHQYEVRVNPGVVRRGTLIYYTSRAFPNDFKQINTIYYYDDYAFDRAGLSVPTTVYGIATTTNVKSMATGVKERVLIAGTEKWITVFTGYDDKARPVYTANKNEYLNTTDTGRSKLDFSGRVLETTLHHTSNTTVSIVESFTYDHAFRLANRNNYLK